MGSSTQDYVEILEKTNQQLSLWYNPYGLMVGILTALVALLAILFAFILWRQGKDYKDAFQAFLDEQKKIADGEISKAISKAQEVLEDASKKLEEIKDLKGQAREDLKKEIAEIKKTKKSLETTSNRVISRGLQRPTLSWSQPKNIRPLGYSLCGFCGAQNPKSAQFCNSCGEALE